MTKSVSAEPQTIRLPRDKWQFDPNAPLGPAGGFGAVFAGTHPLHGDIAVKKLHLSAASAAHRELTIADELANKPFENVIPILDAGEDVESAGYYIVMARGDKSLHDAIIDAGVFNEQDTIKILFAIVSGLLEVQHITHRDLKPQNVLLHGGIWKIADFGIARFVENATSIHTLKQYLTPQYAAPEQWLFETATNATDVYALGCIAYALLTGNPPFTATDQAVLRHSHCNVAPPQLSNSVLPQLRSLIAKLLLKAQDARPSLRRIKDILKSAARHVAPSRVKVDAFGLLSEASATLATQDAEREAARQLEISRAEQRRRLKNEAMSLLLEIFDGFSRLIADRAPMAKCRYVDAENAQGWTVDLGIGRLTMQVFANDVPHNQFSQSKWDVIAVGRVFVFQPEPRYEWSSSLWYAKLPKSSDYRWYEVAYYNHPLSNASGDFEPYAVLEYGLADAAAASSMSPQTIAFGPKAIDDENMHSFYERWAGLLAKASQGRITRPRSFPLAEGSF